MSEAAEAFAHALEAEREAALCADFDALLRIQDEKRELLPVLKATADPAVVEALSERARKNLVLMRQLLQCVQGMLGLDAEPSGYTATGQSSLQAGATPTVRGRL